MAAIPVGARKASGDAVGVKPVARATFGDKSAPRTLPPRSLFRSGPPYSDADVQMMVNGTLALDGPAIMALTLFAPDRSEEENSAGNKLANWRAVERRGVGFCWASSR